MTVLSRLLTLRASFEVHVLRVGQRGAFRSWPPHSSTAAMTILRGATPGHRTALQIQPVNATYGWSRLAARQRNNAAGGATIITVDESRPSCDTVTIYAVELSISIYPCAPPTIPLSTA